jgi:hypothetical protein
MALTVQHEREVGEAKERRARRLRIDIRDARAYLSLGSNGVAQDFCCAASPRPSVDRTGD